MAPKCFFQAFSLKLSPRRKPWQLIRALVGWTEKKHTDLSLPIGQSPRWSERDFQTSSARPWPVPGLPEGPCHRISTRAVGGLEEREFESGIMKQFTIDLITVKSHSNHPGANKGNPLNITREKKTQIKMLKSKQPVSALRWGEQISFNFVFSNIYHPSFSVASLFSFRFRQIPPLMSIGVIWNNSPSLYTDVASCPVQFPHRPGLFWALMEQELYVQPQFPENGPNCTRVNKAN